MPEHRPTIAYRCICLALMPVMLLHAIMRSVKDGGKRYFLQRLVLRQRVKFANQPCRWIHATSVGEVLTVIPLIKELQNHTDNSLFLVTTTTPTGAQVLREAQLKGIEHRYLPMDTRSTCHRFLNQFNIQSLWVVETEIWPWLFASCHRHAIPITIINARLSARTTRHTGRIIGRALRHALQGVRILARSESDADRYRDLGAEPTRVQVIGNLKLGRVASDEHKARLIERHYVIAASTHHDEEIQLGEAWKQLPGTALLVIAPRHPERGPDIQKQLRTHDIDCALRSADEQIQPDQYVYIADTVGEMMHWYTHAAGAFVGGSLIQRGGQNMLEPAQLECPCVVGRHTENFADIMSGLLRADAITVAEQAIEVAGFLDNAANGDTQIVQMARRAKQLATENSDVLRRYLAELQHPH